MNHKRIIEFSLVFFIVAVYGHFCTAFASDYKYKILDPKYNSSIENYIYDETSSTLIEVPQAHKKHPFRKPVLILLFGGIPMFLGYRMIKVLKKIDRASDDEEINFAKEVFAVEEIKSLKKEIRNTASYIKDKLIIVKKPADSERITERLLQIKTMPNKIPDSVSKEQTTTRVQNTISNTHKKTPKKQVKSAQAVPVSPLDRYLSASMKKMQNPLLISSSKLATNKGLCLVQFNDKISLIGYINDKIFILNKFDSLKTNEIRSRLSETVNNKDRYIVRLGSYKALVEVSDQKMQLLLEL